MILNDTLYIIGGQHNPLHKPDVMPKVTNKVHGYDIVRGQWKPVRPMLANRAFHSAVTYEGAIYVVGGKDSQDK